MSELKLFSFASRGNWIVIIKALNSLEYDTDPSKLSRIKFKSYYVTIDWTQFKVKKKHQ